MVEYEAQLVTNLVCQVAVVKSIGMQDNVSMIVLYHTNIVRKKNV